MRLLPIGHDHERRGSSEAPPKSDRGGHRCGSHERLPLQHLSPHSSGDPPGRDQNFGRRGKNMSDHDSAQMNRRDLLATAAAATGALVIGFWMPQRANAQENRPEGAAWANETTTDEVNAWVVVAP